MAALVSHQGHLQESGPLRAETADVELQLGEAVFPVHKAHLEQQSYLFQVRSPVGGLGVGRPAPRRRPPAAPRGHRRTWAPGQPGPSAAPLHSGPSRQLSLLPHLPNAQGLFETHADLQPAAPGLLPRIALGSGSTEGGLAIATEARQALQVQRDGGQQTGVVGSLLVDSRAAGALQALQAQGGLHRTSVIVACTHLLQHSRSRRPYPSSQHTPNIGGGPLLAPAGEAPGAIPVPGLPPGDAAGEPFRRFFPMSPGWLRCVHDVANYCDVVRCGVYAM